MTLSSRMQRSQIGIDRSCKPMHRIQSLLLHARPLLFVVCALPLCGQPFCLRHSRVIRLKHSIRCSVTDLSTFVHVYMYTSGSCAEVFLRTSCTLLFGVHPKQDDVRDPPVHSILHTLYDWTRAFCSCLRLSSTLYMKSITKTGE